MQQADFTKHKGIVCWTYVGMHLSIIQQQNEVIKGKRKTRHLISYLNCYLNYFFWLGSILIHCSKYDFCIFRTPVEIYPSSQAVSADQKCLPATTAEETPSSINGNKHANM